MTTYHCTRCAETIPLDRDQLASLAAADESFFLVPNAPAANGRSAHHTHQPPFLQQDSETLFDVAARTSECDLPLCAECAAALHAKLEASLASSSHYLQALQAKHAQLSLAFHRRDGARLADEAELERLLSQSAALEAELQALERDEAQLRQLEESYCHERSSVDAATLGHHEHIHQLTSTLTSAQTQLRRLHRHSVLADLFVLATEGFYGTVNGCRLGRGGPEVEWPEINAALGYVMHLLVVLGHRESLVYSHYVLHPQGAFSRVEHPERRTYYEVYDGTPPLFGARDSRFNRGVAALVACSQQLGSNLELKLAGTGLPRAPVLVEDDRVGGVSVRLVGSGAGAEEAWTRAMRNWLVYLKWCMMASVQREALQVQASS
jgi:beclin 1